MDQSSYIGMGAALATSVLWAMSSIFFSIAGKRLGSLIVNRIRLMFAVLWLLITHFIVYGTLVPVNAGLDRWMWFALSGVVGLAIGDAFLFQAYVLIGPRITTLLMASSPVISTILGLIFFREIPTFLELLGITVTIGGTFLVILDGRQNGTHAIEEKHHNYILGVGLGFGAAVCQSVGLALAKNGLTDQFPSLSGTLMRMISAMLAIWLISLLTGSAGSTLRETGRNQKGLLAIMGGSIVGPFLGVWCSLIAAQSELLGIASTLMALSPVFVLPFVYFVFKERVSRLAVIGTFIALSGTTLLMLASSGFFAQ
jgi:drug/metabolite transporter (DMT)-like permease